MQMHYSENEIDMQDETGKVLAKVTFPSVSQQTVNINHTFVDDSLRGQGVASQLLTGVAQELRKTGRKAVLTCPYAVQWFPKHPEFADVLAEK